MKLPIQNNPLQSRQDLMDGLSSLLTPLNKHFSHNNTQVTYGHTGSRTWSRTAGLEGLLRPLWGLVPATAGGATSDLWDRYREAICYGTDPTNPLYWGDLDDSDQSMVEMASLGLALAMTPEEIWVPLSEEVKNNFAAWLGQINHRDLPDNNWRFFIVMVNIGLKKVKAPYDGDRMEKELVRLESFYLSEGWYSDGATEQRDYYVSFAMHFYGLIYSKLMGQDDPVRAKRFKDRGAAFAKDFIYWFSDKGDALPYGRSLIYRFAQCAFWGALAFADVEVFSWGVMKGIVLRHLRDWFAKPIFDSDGVLTLGYNYENLLMTEGYNAPGSVYWSMKAMIILGLGEDHAFWQSEEAPLPDLKKKVVQKHPHMVICRENPSHFAAFTSGQHASFEPAHMAAKYEKFVYSNLFGFSVPKGTYSLEQGAYDNMLALSEQDGYYRGRHTSTIMDIDKDKIVSQWSLWKDVHITTWLIPGLPWHLRIHHITTNRPLDLAEGGYAITRENQAGTLKAEIQQQLYGIVVSHPSDNSGCSAIYDLLNEAKTLCIQPEANTNICTPRTYIPTLYKQVEAGSHWMISAVYGSSTSKVPVELPRIIKSQDNQQAEILFEGKTLTINFKTEQVRINQVKED